MAMFHEGKHNISHMDMDISRGLMVTCGSDRIVKVATVLLRYDWGDLFGLELSVTCIKSLTHHNILWNKEILAQLHLSDLLFPQIWDMIQVVGSNISAGSH